MSKVVAGLSAWLQLKRPDFSEVQGPSPRVQRCRLELLPFSFPLPFPQHLQLFPLQVLLLGLPPGQLNGLLCLLLVILVLQLAQVLLQRTHFIHQARGLSLPDKGCDVVDLLEEWVRVFDLPLTS